MVGWLGVLGWQTGAATVSYLAGQQIQGLILLNNPSYIPKVWHGTLLIWFVLSICLLFNTFFSRLLPLVESIIVVLHGIGFFAVIIPLWIMGDRKASGDVFTLFQDNMLWGNLPLAVMIGLTGATGTFVGVEAGAHMAEEVLNAAYVIPRAMMWTWLGNGLLGWVMAITFCFCVGDTMAVLTTPLGVPFIQVFVDTTRSAAGATGLTVLMLVIAIFACVAVMATSARQLFAFARDNGVPFPRAFGKVSMVSARHVVLPANIVAGLPDSEGASQCGIRDASVRCNPFVYQYWLQRSFHASDFSWSRCDADFLHYIDFLCYFEENPG